MRAISLCLAVIALALGANAQCPLINEFKYVSNPFSVQVEIVNPNPVATLEACVFDIFNTAGENLHCEAIAPMNPNEIRVITPNLPLRRTDDFLVTISQNQSPDVDLGIPLADLIESTIRDSFYYPLRTPTVFPALFMQKVPEWAAQGQWNEADSVYRCGLLPRDPTQWFIVNTPNTLNGPNDCEIDPVTGDPHFVQTVVDKKTGKQRYICYDVSGKSGQSIYILKDNVHDIKVEGVLLDDYYMHEIRLTIEGRPMSISKHGIIYMGKRYEWEGYNILYLEGSTVTVSRNMVTVQIMKNDRSVFTLKVKRSVNKFNVEHLDVDFTDLENDLTRYSGIIGDISQKEFQVFETVQSQNVVDVSVNGKVIRGRFERRDQMECILLSFDSLADSRVEQYVY